MIRRFVLIGIYMLLNVQILAGCMFDENRPQTRYHENVEEIEEFILSDLGDFIMFHEPEVSDSYSGSEGDELIVWHVDFLRKFINDDEKTDSYPIGSVISDFYALYNNYMADHPDCYLSDYYVIVNFNIPAKDSNYYPPVSWCGYVTNIDNYDSETLNKGNQLTGVSLADEYWPYMYGNDEIEVAYMFNNTFEQIIAVADNMPHIKKIVVADQTIADEATRLRPDVVFETP